MAETYVCDECWSEDISTDATAVWDKKKQEWVLDDFGNNTDWCRDCEGDCRTDTMPLDDKGEVEWPSVDEVIESEVVAHMKARARISQEGSDSIETYRENVEKLYAGILDQDATGDAIEMCAKHDILDHGIVEDIAVAGTNHHHMLEYIRSIYRGDRMRVFNRLLELVVEKRDPSMIEGVLRVYHEKDKNSYVYERSHLGLPGEEIDRMRAVYKLVGGKENY